MTDLPMDKILAILEASREPISLETPVGDDDSTLGDFLENSESESPYDTVQNRELAGRVTEVLSTLTDREEKIIRLRFGIGEKAEYILRRSVKNSMFPVSGFARLRKKHSIGCATQVVGINCVIFSTDTGQIIFCCSKASFLWKGLFLFFSGDFSLFRVFVEAFAFV
ncbi:Sigma-70 region 3 [Candidatus Electrothrix communis]|uniref:Sigma-70 region 3 n=1 Tax=Candidatus Electrothrix communis TaxID=1859133 RepID=A0A3S3R2B3_9BACT|nr:Sigma-70 region 3 [Candidatus Electrothrix communis]